MFSFGAFVFVVLDVSVCYNWTKEWKKTEKGWDCYANAAKKSTNPACAAGAFYRFFVHNHPVLFNSVYQLPGTQQTP
jgi:hypothetical protein